jgi:flagellar FliL protein
MANEDDRTKVEGANAEQPAEAPAKSGGKSKLMIMGIVGVAAIAIGIVVALFVVKPMMAGSGQADATAEVSHSDSGKEVEKPKAESKKKSAKGEHGASVVYDIDDIVINPAGTGGTRFLSASFAFELESEEAAKEFEAREALIRDALITILSSKTIAQLTDVKQKEITRYQIKKRISEILNTEELAGVFYTDFVLQ